MREHEHILPIPIYDLELVTVVTSDLLRSRITRQKKLGTVHNTKDFEGLAGLSSNKHPYYTIFFQTPLTHETIAHEIDHCVSKMLDDVGVKFDIKNHEPHAYLVGWVTKHIYSFLFDSGLKVS